jgi:hypothetical protein
MKTRRNDQRNGQISSVLPFFLRHFFVVVFRFSSFISTPFLSTVVAVLSELPSWGESLSFSLPVLHDGDRGFFMTAIVERKGREEGWDGTGREEARKDGQKNGRTGGRKDGRTDGST